MQNNIGDILEKKKLKNLSLNVLLGMAIGSVNGLFGAGGGMIAVPMLKSKGLSQKQAHKNAVAVILPLTVLSAIMYIIKGYVKPSSALIYIPTGVIGSLIGIKILEKISPKLLKGIFGGFMVYAGVRLLLR